MGCIAEQDALAGRFKMSEDERIEDKDQERLLLLATIEEILRHEIALREQAADGAYLVFPTEFVREHPDLPGPEGRAMVFTFDGPVRNIYAALTVRLTHSGLFAKREMWRNAAAIRP